MMTKKEVRQFIAIFIIELLIFLPFYVADVFAAQPVISNIQAAPSSDSATITWQTDIPSTSVIHYGQNSQVELSRTDLSASTTHSVGISPLAISTKYYFKAESCDGSDCSSSSTIDFTTTGPQPPAKITGLTNGSIKRTTAEIRWGESSSQYFGYYKIYRNNNVVANITSKGTTQFSDTGLTPATQYQYEVSAVNSEGIEGQKSDPLTITTAAPDTTKPTINNVTLTSPSLTSVTVVWTTDEDSNSTVFYGTSASNLNLKQYSSNYALSHSVTLANLQNSTTYFCKVQSCDQDGNCAEKQCPNSFKPTQVTDLSIQLTVPRIYNAAVVPVTGTATAYSNVRFFVNDVYKGLFSADRNTNGNIYFEVPGFYSGNNTIKASVEDSFGNKKDSQTYSVMVDMTPPQLAVTPLPSKISSPKVTINGSVSERSTIKIYVKLKQSQDTTAPSQVPNLHVDRAAQNSVTLSWSNINDTDFSQYIIYRDDVPIATAVSSPFTDDESVSSGRSYRYEVAAVDTNCNIGPKNVVNAQTEIGGVTYNNTPEAEQIRCLNPDQTPKYTLNSQYPNFRSDISLEQGVNEVIVEAVDEANNSAKQTFEVYYDSEKPQILSTNLDTLNPSYIRDVTIEGTVSEDAYVCVYINSEPDTRPYRPSEVNESANFSGSKYCDNTQNKTFSIDIQLERNPDYAYDAESQTTQQQRMFVSIGDAWTNNIKVVATDSVGLSSRPEEGVILYALCGNSGDWSLLVDDVIPSEIVPRYLIEGMAQVGVSLDLSWRGSGTPSGVTDIDVREGYPMGMSESLNQRFDTAWISQLSDTWSDEYNKGYILIDLKAKDPTPPGKNWTMLEKEQNLSKHNQGRCFNVPFARQDESYIKSAGCVRVPLTVEISYEKDVNFRNSRGVYEPRKETVTQKECVTVDVLIQPRIPPDIIPDSFLKSAVNFLNQTINLIDKVLEPLEKVLKATMIICFAMWAALYLKKVTEGFSCFGKNIFSDNSCNCVASATEVKCTKPDGKEDDKCQSCVESKINTKNFEKMMHWVCDRIMCPSVPSYEKYVRDNSKTGSKSNCEGLAAASYGTPPSTTNLNKNKDLCNNAPKGFVGKTGPITTPPDNICCDEEYYREWSSACATMNPLKESYALAHPETQDSLSQIWRSVSNFKLCRPGDNDEQQINIEGQWFILKKNKDYEQLTKEQKEKTFEWDVWVGTNKRVRTLSNGNLLNDTEKVTPGTKLTGTQILKENCAKYGNTITTKSMNWPKYEKTITEENTINYLNPNPELSLSEMRAQVNDFKTNDTEFIKKYITVQVTLPNDPTRYDYKYEKDKYVLQNGNGYEIEIQPDGKKIIKKQDITPPQKTATQKTAPVPESIVSQACAGLGQDIIVNPTDSIFRSIQCVCLSALYSYLKMYKKILGLIKDCFQTILITGDGSSGVCQAVLSYYVCDLLYYMFSCFKGYTGFGTKERSVSPTLDFLKGIVGAGAEVQQSVQDRYGDTNMFKVMFVDKKIIHAMCLAFFGADADIDLSALAEQSVNMPIKSTVSVFPANRRFVGFNPIDGITNHVYHAGLMIVSGSDNMRYNVYLVCSTNNQCDRNYFDDGRCDCARSGSERTMDITNQFGGNGKLNNGETLTEEAFVQVNYNTAEARIRYDKIRVEYDYLDNSGHVKKERVERELSQIGSAPLASCSFDLIGGIFRCGVFTEGTTACLTNNAKIQFAKDNNGFMDVTDGNIYSAENGKLKFTFNARRDSTTGDKSKTFYATLNIMDGSTSLQTINLPIESDTEREYTFGGSGQTKIEIKPSWFGGTSSSSGSCIIQKNGIGISSIASCNKDAEIKCTKASTGDTINFEIYEGTYTSPASASSSGSFRSDGTSPVKCSIQNTQSSADCGSYKINLGTFSNVVTNCDGAKTVWVDKQDISTTTSSSDTKSLTYTITMYRPIADSPRSISTTKAKCNGQLQERQGSFTIYKTQSPAIAQQAAQNQASIDQGKDTQKPTITLKVNNVEVQGQQDEQKKIGFVRLNNQYNTLCTGSIDISGKVVDVEQKPTTGNSFYSGIQSVEIFIDEDINVLAKTFDTKQQTFDFSSTDIECNPIEEGLHNIKVIAKDKANNIAEKEVIGVHFGAPCGESGACTNWGLCVQTWNFKENNANQQDCLGNICCVKS